MSLWGWLRDAFGGRIPDIEPEAELPPEEALLRNLLLRITEPSDDQMRVDRRRSRVLGGGAAAAGDGARAYGHRSAEPLRRRAAR